MTTGINYLECFLHLCETLSFSETARRMAITQPCVSRQIRMLEESLATQLFVRDRHSVHLTRKGEDLWRHIGPLYREIDESLRSLQVQSQEISGTIHIGSLSEVGQSLFSKIFLRFREKYPRVLLSVEFLRNDEIVRAVETGKLDFGIVTMMADKDSLRFYEILTEEAILVTRMENPHDLSHAKCLDFVTYRANDPLFRAFRRSFPEIFADREVREIVRVNSHRSMLEVVLENDVWSVMPFLSVEPYLRSNQLRRAHTAVLRNAIYLVHRQNNLVEKKDKVFSEFVRKQARTLERELGVRRAED